MTIEFSPYHESDSAYIWRTYTGAMKDHVEKIWGWDEAWQRDNFSKSLNEYKTFVLISGDCRIGYLQIKYEVDFTFISMIILESSFQSKGLGPQVLAKLTALRPELPLKLRCFKVNHRANHFYRQNGFKEIEVDDCFYTLYREEGIL